MGAGVGSSVGLGVEKLGGLLGSKEGAGEGGSIQVPPWQNPYGLLLHGVPSATCTSLLGHVPSGSHF